MEFSDLTQEQMDKVEACKTQEELLELAKAEGIELTDEDLDKVSGGSTWGIGTVTNPAPAACTWCGSTDTVLHTTSPRVGQSGYWSCMSCHRDFYAPVYEA